MALLAASASLSSVSLRSAVQASASAPSGTHSSRLASAAASIPLLLSKEAAAVQCGRINMEVGSSALAGALFAALASSDSAMAAQEVMNLAAADNDSRGLLLLIVLAPAVGWVLFNILKPGLSQLDKMNAAKGVVGAIGLSSALLLCTPQADAAVQEISSLADGMVTSNSDARGILLLGVLVPAVGWVLFNILRPGLSQLDKMKSAKGMIGAVGLAGAMMLTASQADAAVQELTKIVDSVGPASSDSRGLLLVAALVPALGWVLFNILQPALNQFDRMKISKGVAAAVGLGAASALLPSRADALQELASLGADNDSRGTLLLAVLIPAVGWVLFNILQPALNQFDKKKAQK